MEPKSKKFMKYQSGRIRELLGTSTLEKAISIMIILTIITTAVEILMFIINHPPDKFYYAVLFNVALLGALLHVRASLAEEPEDYKTLRIDLQKSKILTADETEKYLQDKKNWLAYTTWLRLSIGLALLFLFVYILTP